MIAIIFEVFPKKGKVEEYLDIAARMRPMVENVEGFISVERFRSISNPDKLLSISYFVDEAAVARWRNLSEHRTAQSKGRSDIFDDYRIKVLSVIRDYGMDDREQAPTDSLKFHGS